MLSTYQEFLTTVEAFGLLSLSANLVEGFPVLNDLTKETQWHTGDPETDPWQWKDRAAMEGKLAFGCILGGKKGFISKDLYPLFYAACHPETDLEERYDRGLLPKTVMDVYSLFNTRKVLSTADIRSELGGAKSALDKAVVMLQKEFYLTVCGNQRKVSKDGKEYGWPANTYCKIEAWAPEWINGAGLIPKAEAQQKILNHCDTWQRNIDLKKLSKNLFR